MYKIIPNFEDYEISESGKIRERETGREISPFSQDDYSFVTLKKRKRYPDFDEEKSRGVNSYFFETVSIHRLMGETFLEQKEDDEEIIHINGIKKDDRIENLKWISNQEVNRIKKEKYLVKQEIKRRLMEHFPNLAIAEYDDLISSLLIIQVFANKYQFGVCTSHYELRNDCLNYIMEDIYNIVKNFYFEKRGIDYEK